MDPPEGENQEQDFSSAPHLSDSKIASSSELTQLLEGTTDAEATQKVREPQAEEVLDSTFEFQKLELTASQQQTMDQKTFAASSANQKIDSDYGSEKDKREDDLTSIIPKDFVLNDDSKDESGSQEKNGEAQPTADPDQDGPAEKKSEELTLMPELPLLADPPADAPVIPPELTKEGEPEEAAGESNAATPLKDQDQKAAEPEDKAPEAEKAPDDPPIIEEKEEKDFKEGSEPSQSYSQQFAQTAEPAKNSGFIPAESDFNKLPDLVSSQYGVPHEEKSQEKEPSSMLTSVVQMHPPSGYNIGPSSRNNSPHSASNSQPGQGQPAVQMFGTPQGFPPTPTAPQQPDPLQAVNNQTFGAHTQPGQVSHQSSSPTGNQQGNQPNYQSFRHLPQGPQVSGTFNPNSGNFTNSITGNNIRDPNSASPPPATGQGPAHLNQQAAVVAGQHGGPPINLSNMNPNGPQQFGNSGQMPPHPGQQFSMPQQPPQQNNFHRLPQYQRQQFENQFQTQQQMARDSQFRELMFGEVLQTNKQLLQSVQETSRQALQGIQMIAGMVAPLLETKERENRKLKRLLSQRYGISTEDEIIEAELNGRSGRTRFPKRSRIQEESEESEDNHSPSKPPEDTSFNVSNEVSRPSEAAAQPRKVFIPNNNRAVPLKPIDQPKMPAEPKPNLNFRRKTAQDSQPTYTLKPNQKPFVAPSARPPERTVKPPPAAIETQAEDDFAEGAASEPRASSQQAEIDSQPQPEFEGFSLGTRKRLEVKNLEKAEALMQRMEEEDGGNLLESLKVGNKDSKFSSIEAMAAEEHKVVEDRVAKLTNQD